MQDSNGATRAGPLVSAVNPRDHLEWAPFYRIARTLQRPLPGGRLLPYAVRAFWWVVLALAPALLGAESGTVEELTTWAKGPVQWLLQPDERKALRRIESTSEALAFIESFWRRRDPSPLGEGNLYREIFQQRVEAADVLYGEGKTRGALTDRGRALILLGPPSHVTVATEPALVWEKATSSQRRWSTRRVSVEEWGYRLEDLPPELLKRWLERKKAAESTLALTLRFRSASRRTVLVEGEALLELAAKAGVREE